MKKTEVDVHGCSIVMPEHIKKLIICPAEYEDKRIIDEYGWNLDINRDLDEYMLGIHE